jgi:hypothetical protein
MEDKKYPLTPPIDYNYSAVSYTVQVIYIELNSYATIGASLFTADNRLVENKSYLLQGEEYQLWLSDDYLIQWVRIQLEKDSLLPLRP